MVEMGKVDYSGIIPTNVPMTDTLVKALGKWRPEFLKWWEEVGPQGFSGDEIYLRTAVGIDSDGWAQFDHVRMRDYRWGILLAAHDGRERIGFGDGLEKKVFQNSRGEDELPGDLRDYIQTLIVNQGDTEPGSVEQQRHLGKTAPSLYDLRNLFQVNVEEGRHLWAMVYLLHQYLGSKGREQAMDLLTRRSGDPNSPRILSTFNDPIDEWLSFYCFAMFCDRDGKFQLNALSQSGFLPLARTTKFMLTEEAHHLFVGEDGIRRVVQATAKYMNKTGHDDAKIKENGQVIPLDILQRYINFWYSSSIDLFGSESSSNAIGYFASGLKGRYDELARVGRQGDYPDHVLLTGTREVYIVKDGRVVLGSVDSRRALNEDLRDEYVKDCLRALTRWNKVLEEAGIEGRLYLPDRRFSRRMGVAKMESGTTKGHYFTAIENAHEIVVEPTTNRKTTKEATGKEITKEEFEKRRDEWLPTSQDKAYVMSLMKPYIIPGQFASWIAPPSKGINGQPLDFEYAKGQGVERLRRAV